MIRNLIYFLVFILLFLIVNMNFYHYLTDKEQIKYLYHSGIAAGFMMLFLTINLLSKYIDEHLPSKHTYILKIVSFDLFLLSAYNLVDELVGINTVDYVFDWVALGCIAVFTAYRAYAHYK